MPSFEFNGHALLIDEEGSPFFALFFLLCHVALVAIVNHTKHSTEWENPLRFPKKKIIWKVVG